jgi:hypothetical protein
MYRPGKYAPMPQFPRNASNQLGVGLNEHHHAQTGSEEMSPLCTFGYTP